MCEKEVNRVEVRRLNLLKEPAFEVREGLFNYTKELIEQAYKDSSRDLMQDEERSELILTSARVLQNFLTKGWSSSRELSMDRQKEIVAVGIVEHGGHFDQNLIDFVESTNNPREVFLQIGNALNARMHVGRFGDEKRQLIKEWESVNEILLSNQGKGNELQQSLDNYNKDYVYPEPKTREELAERIILQFDSKDPKRAIKRRDCFMRTNLLVS
jgi:hypothetical protein